MTDPTTNPSFAAEGLARVEGPSFSAPMKLMSSALVLGLLAAGAQVLQQGAWEQWNGSTRWLMGGVGTVILTGYWGILRSRTSIDGLCIRQSWLWHKEVRLADITRLKLIHVPGWTWLVAPRLVVQAGAIGVTTFHVADPKLIEAMKKLAYG